MSCSGMHRRQQDSAVPIPTDNSQKVLDLSIRIHTDNNTNRCVPPIFLVETLIITDMTYVSYTVGQIRRRLFRFTSAKKSIHYDFQNYTTRNTHKNLKTRLRFVYGSDCFSCEWRMRESKIIMTDRCHVPYSPMVSSSEHVSGAENGAERAKSAAQSPLTPILR